MAEYLPVGTASQKRPTVDEINALTEATGWGQREQSVWERVLDASSYVAYSRDDGGRLIGFGRILEDGVMCMFYDICVHPDKQGEGVGSQIMKELVGKVRDVGYVSIGLFVWEDNASAREFYEKFGFESVETGMELKRFMKPE